MCGDCAERPELEICPQCRVVLAGRLSRNRALEELARKTFPYEEEESRRLWATLGDVEIRCFHWILFGFIEFMLHIHNKQTMYCIALQ